MTSRESPVVAPGEKVGESAHALLESVRQMRDSANCGDRYVVRDIICEGETNVSCSVIDTDMVCSKATNRPYCHTSQRSIELGALAQSLSWSGYPSI